MLETQDQVHILRSTVYDGVNGEEIVAQFNGTIIEDTGTLLRYYDEGGSYSAALGDRVFWTSTEQSAGAQPELFPFPWRLWPETTSVPVTGYALVTVTGSAAVPASLLGGQQTLTVNLGPVAGGEGAVLSGTVYTPVADLRGAPNIISGHGIVTGGVSVVSPSQVQVVVQSGIGSLAGGTAYVVAQQLQIV